MKVFGNIRVRAHKYFHGTIKMFAINLVKEADLSYSGKDGNNNAYWNFDFILNRSFISRIFKLHIHYSFPIDSSVELTENLTWDYRKKNWKSSEKNSDFKNMINTNSTIKKGIKSMDFETIEIKRGKGEFKFTMVPIPGSYIFMLFPPMQYFLKLKKQEIDLMKKLAFLTQELNDEFQNKQKVAT